MKEKVVLAYSGGLDTSIILKWLLLEGYDVICFMADVGQEEDFGEAEKKALSIGASQVYVEDLKTEFVTDYIFQALKASRPEVPDRALEVMDRELMALFSEKMAAPGGLMDQVIPVYHKYFTHQEIRELLDFYQTPIGKKAIMVLPRVVSDSMVAGRRWGESLGPEIETRVRAALEREGLLPKGM